jgi:hypothetical protein
LCTTTRKKIIRLETRYDWREELLAMVLAVLCGIKPVAVAQQRLHTDLWPKFHLVPYKKNAKYSKRTFNPCLGPVMSEKSMQKQILTCKKFWFQRV